MIGDRLTLVTSFADLQAGDLVVVRGCAQCGRDCRGMLTKLITGAEDVEDFETDLTVWVIEPNCIDSAVDTSISAREVEMGRVYRVDAGLEASSTTTAATRKRKGVRA